MKYPRQKLFGKTWVGWLNIFILQWFFIRLAGMLSDDSEEVKWTILTRIVPCTGWWSDYKKI